MAILESVKKLASKVGADTNGRTIAEQINNINRHLDSTGSRDIAEAVSKFADKEDGTAKLGTKTITENDTYIALDDELDGYSSVTVNVAGGGGETFEVEIDYDSANNNFVANKTINEVATAFENDLVSVKITNNVKTYIEAQHVGKTIEYTNYPVFNWRHFSEEIGNVLFCTIAYIADDNPMTTETFLWIFTPDYSASAIYLVSGTVEC